MTKTVGVIGAGIGGLALSIRLANQFKVTFFEK
jgi:phytoene dehydrogenase-like protein